MCKGTVAPVSDVIKVAKMNRSDSAEALLKVYKFSEAPPSIRLSSPSGPAKSQSLFKSPAERPRAKPCKKVVQYPFDIFQEGISCLEQKKMFTSWVLIYLRDSLWREAG
jgi:hypothetical protein